MYPSSNKDLAMHQPIPSAAAEIIIFLLADFNDRLCIRHSVSIYKLLDFETQLFLCYSRLDNDFFFAHSVLISSVSLLIRPLAGFLFVFILESSLSICLSVLAERIGKISFGFLNVSEYDLDSSNPFNVLP